MVEEQKSKKIKSTKFEQNKQNWAVWRTEQICFVAGMQHSHTRRNQGMSQQYLNQGI